MRLMGKHERRYRERARSNIMPALALRNRNIRSSPLYVVLTDGRWGLRLIHA
jgi:hypothetical protein